MKKTKDSELSAYECDVLLSAEKNHLWLNAFACVRPTTELKLQIADWVLGKLNDKDSLIYDNQDHPSEAMRTLGKLTPQIILRVNKS